MLDLFEAIRRNQCDQFPHLIEPSDLEQVDANGFSPLRAACLAQSLKCTQALLEAGANPNSADDSGYTALHLAALSSTPEGADQCYWLIQRAANLESRLRGDQKYEQVRDWTPLMLAAAEGWSPAVATLAKMGANVNATDWAGMTPLMLAARQSSDTFDKVEILLETGALAKTRSNDGYTALEYARSQAHLLYEGRTDPNALRWLKDQRKKTLENIKSLLLDRLGELDAGVKAALSSYTDIVGADLNEQIGHSLREWSRTIQLLEEVTCD